MFYLLKEESLELVQVMILVIKIFNINQNVN